MSGRVEDMTGELSLEMIKNLLESPTRITTNKLFRIDNIETDSTMTLHYLIQELPNCEELKIVAILPRLNLIDAKSVIEQLDYDMVYAVMVRLSGQLKFKSNASFHRHQSLIRYTLSRLSKFHTDYGEKIIDAIVATQFDTDCPIAFRDLSEGNSMGREVMRQKLDPHSVYYAWKKCTDNGNGNLHS